MRADVSLSYTLPLTAAQTTPQAPPAFEDGDTVAVGPRGVQIVARSAPEERGPAQGARHHRAGVECVCLYCGGPLRRGRAPVRVVREGYRLECRLPAWICKRCDEPYFEPGEVARVRDALRAARRRAHGRA
ncbi:MAG TPA: hypothetical protein VF121_05950 [Thermoanaerobaculia bacterium]|nr:hypothetical protein [Thermoanaerobaculia bacterium]